MTNDEKKALIMAGISARNEQYQEVKKWLDSPLKTIQAETGYTQHFITQCRKIAGWTRRKTLQ